MKRVHIQTFGCQMNVHDSRRIEEVLSGEGYSAVDSAGEADLVVFNTCSVREKADHKLYSAVGTLRELKAERPGLVVAVAGCLAQQQGEALLSRLDLVDVVIGPDNIADLAGLVERSRDGAGPVALTEFDLDAPSFLTARGRADRSEATAYVTVMKGCDERCTYCIVPYTRGAERYRGGDEIVAEVVQLVADGVREITLLGQTVNSWHEPGQAPAAAEEPELARGRVVRGESRFAELLRRIAGEVPELARLRYTSPHPRHVTTALVEAHTQLDVLPAHVHLPVQSGSDRMLKRMLRRYRRDDYIARAHALMESRPGFTLSTDIIVGFPGETDDDFEQTLTLVREVGFTSAFAFKYSPRPHTPSLALEDDVSRELKSERLARLFEVTEAQQRAHLETLVGTRTEVLFEGPSKSSRTALSGRSSRHEIVHVEAPGHDLTGRVIDVEITQANKHSLVGEPVAALPDAALRSPGDAQPMRLPVV